MPAASQQEQRVELLEQVLGSSFRVAQTLSFTPENLSADAIPMETTDDFITAPTEIESVNHRIMTHRQFSSLKDFS